MKTRTITLLITLLLVFSNLGMAQVLDPLSLMKEKPQLKTDVEGSYPQTILEYNWMVEMWMLLQTTYITYTSVGQPSEVRVVGMDGETRTLMTYNSNHFETESLDQNKEGDVWVNYERTTTEYDNGDFPIKMIVEDWNGSGWDLVFGTQYEFTYDGNVITGLVLQIWDRDANAWVNSARIQQSYSSADGKLIEATTESWINGAWENTGKSKYVWIGDQLSEMYMSGWVDGAWVESTKMVHEYGDNESLVMTMYSGPGDGTWTPAQRITDNFDSHGNLILNMIEFYGTDWEILSGSQYNITYDGNNITERITQMYSLFEPEDLGATFTPTWKNVYREVFSDFASLSVDPQLIGVETVKYYPNPAMDETILKLSNLKNTNLTINVLSLTGQLSLSEQIFVPLDEFNHSLNLSELPAGTFILVVKDESGKVVSSSRLMHQK